MEVLVAITFYLKESITTTINYTVKSQHIEIENNCKIKYLSFHFFQIRFLIASDI